MDGMQDEKEEDLRTTKVFRLSNWASVGVIY